MPPQPSALPPGSTASRARRYLPGADSHLHELVPRQVQVLIDLRHFLNEPRYEVSIAILRDLRDEGWPDRRAVLVQRDLAYRGLKLQVLQRLTILLLAIGEIAVHRVQGIKSCLDTAVVGEREE